MADDHDVQGNNGIDEQVQGGRGVDDQDRGEEQLDHGVDKDKEGHGVDDQDRGEAQVDHGDDKNKEGHCVDDQDGGELHGNPEQEQEGHGVEIDVRGNNGVKGEFQETNGTLNEVRVDHSFNYKDDEDNKNGGEEEQDENGNGNVYGQEKQIHDIDDEAQDDSSVDDYIQGKNQTEAQTNTKKGETNYENSSLKDDGLFTVRKKTGAKQNHKRNMKDKCHVNILDPCTNQFLILEKYDGMSYEEIIESMKNSPLDQIQSKKQKNSKEIEKKETPNTKKTNDARQDLKRKEHTTKKLKAMQNKFKRREGKTIKKDERVNSTTVQAITERCHKCFITHWPYHKFCRWAKAKKEKQNFPQKPLLFSEETVKLIYDRIHFLKQCKDMKVKDKMTNKHTDYLEISDSFLKKSCDASNMSDICFQTFNSDFYPEENLKLKGGARLKIFDTEEPELSRVISIFRSLQVFNAFNGHKKCNLTTKGSLCTFCLLRSLVLKSRISEGRQLIKPVEILCDLSVETESQPTVEYVNGAIEKIKKVFQLSMTF